MKDNIDSVANNFGNGDAIHTMTDNANNLQNIQKISAGAPKDKDSGVDVVRTAKSDEDGKFKKNHSQDEQRVARLKRHNRNLRDKRLTAVQENNSKVRTVLFFLKKKYDPQSLVQEIAPKREMPRINIPSLAEMLAMPVIQKADASLRQGVAVLKNTSQTKAVAAGSTLTLAVLLGLGAFGSAPLASPRFYAEASQPLNPLSYLFDKEITARSPWVAGKANCQLHNKFPLKMKMIAQLPKA
jgi:hypothetical protein